jgi:hypothetical protein
MLPHRQRRGIPHDTELVKELKRCEAGGANLPGLVMAYVRIDSRAYLAMPSGRLEQTRKDFIGWVDTYLRAHASQPYQYRGLDVYAARCAVHHAFSSEAELHRGTQRSASSATTAEAHMVDLAKAPRLALIGTASFLNDVVGAAEAFLGQCEEDAALRARVESRTPTACCTPVPPRRCG